ncbi:mannitol dehydrogenase family protein [Roseibium sp.]|uniref:mannitol dehydrogenase family protein n=1 Tax=Roseibium sp. TaxID=1936156 RepID=UPI003D14C91D
MDELIPLSDATLTAIPSKVTKPGYDRSALTPGIVHVGVGNFHRAHQAVYLDRLFDKGVDHDWAIIGAGIKPYDAAMRKKLADQDWYSTIIELDPEGFEARVTGAMIDFAKIEPEALLAVLIRPEIRIVSLTITEGGYYVDAQTGGFDVKHPDIKNDINNLGTPETIFGLLISALRLRKDGGLAPFTIMSCDNLPENGKVAKQAVVGLAQELAPELVDWIKANVAFPSSMVDCITPATTDQMKALVKDEFCIVDQAPVACEPFRQWVMEDDFSAGRPRLEEVGVEFVEDVAPFELMKLRILNGGHAAIAYPSALLGHEAVHQAMADPDISGWLTTLMRTNVIPIVPPPPGVDLDVYLQTCVGRFSNHAVDDRINRLCLDGSNRQPKFVLPSITDALRVGRPINGLALEVAFWCRYCAATADGTLSIPLEDERCAQLQEAALKTRSDPMAFLQLTEVFGPLSQHTHFQNAFKEAVSMVWEVGVRHTLQRYLQKEGTCQP